MKRIFVTGGLGQIGTELTRLLRRTYGDHNVICSSRSRKDNSVLEEGPFEVVDVRDGDALYEVVHKHRVDTIIHLAALLSGTGELYPDKAWDINMNGLINVLEVGKQEGLQIFTPSSIAAFGPLTPKDQTPQHTIQRPATMYGITKVAGENLCDYYYRRYGLDTRGVRYPGLISNTIEPSGGTTDYAVHIYYEAIKTGQYVCPIDKGTYMDMMYMPDALRAVIDLMEADGSKLRCRNAYNITAMSFTPEMLLSEIQKHMPQLTMTYEVDSMLQQNADSWPNSLDDHYAREDWGWHPEFDIKKMTTDMLRILGNRLSKVNTE